MTRVRTSLGVQGICIYTVTSGTALRHRSSEYGGVLQGRDVDQTRSSGFEICECGQLYALSLSLSLCTS